eukprot:scaffold166010_cov50-Prasinocladus_malaysianus.AAC.1
MGRSAYSCAEPFADFPQCSHQPRPQNISILRHPAIFTAGVTCRTSAVLQKSDQVPYRTHTTNPRPESRPSRAEPSRAA